MNIVLFMTLVVIALAVTGAQTSSDHDFSVDMSAYKPSRRCHVQLVVARYAEDLSWLHHMPFSDILVYDKAEDPLDGTHGNAPAHARVETLPNVGRCDHTYLYHILHKWDELADVTIFVSGSCAVSPVKWNKLSWVVSHVSRTADSAFPVDVVTALPVHESMGNFKLDKYQATAMANSSANPERALQLCRDRPLSKFYAANFPDMPPVHGVCFKGVFAVSRRHIQQTPKSTYARLLSYVDSHSNPEAGHFLERCWLAVFYPVPDECLSVRYWDDAWDVTWIAFWTVAVFLTLIVTQNIS